MPPFVLISQVIPQACLFFWLSVCVCGARPREDRLPFQLQYIKHPHMP